MEHLLNCVVQNKPARINQDGAAGDALCLGCIVCDYQGSQMLVAKHTRQKRLNLAFCSVIQG
jgi:hypothetical protein